jgi:hypothetical protein
MDGYAALRALRADPRTAHVPTVGLTALGYISKPIDTRTFSTTVARLLGST